MRFSALTIAILVLGSSTVETTRGHPASLATAATAATAARILYSSDWSGTGQIYAVDPSGRRGPGQLTFGAAPACIPGKPCGYEAPSASPDGRFVAYWDGVSQGRWHKTLYVARSDGRIRRVAGEIDYLWARAAWAPDSRRIAYTGSLGVHVVRADGSRRLRVYGYARPMLSDELAWSPDGRRLAVRHGNELAVVTGTRARVIAKVDALDSFAWAPTGDRLVYSSCDYPSATLILVRPDGSDRRTLTHASCWSDISWSPAGRWIAFTDRDVLKVFDLTTRAIRSVGMVALYGDDGPLAWSRDGRLLAFDDTERGITIANAATRATRTPSVDHASELVWSPVGRTLAYLGVRGLRVATTTGSVRTVVAAAGDYGGIMRGLSWTRPPSGTRYREASGRLLAHVAPDQLTAPSAITRLAADGQRVAYVSCGHVFVWTPANRAVEQAETVASLSPACSSPTYNPGRGISSLAVAGDRVAFGHIGGGNITFWSLESVTLTPGRPGYPLGEGRATTGTPKSNYVGDPVGGGSLLAFGARDEGFANGRVFTTSQRIVRSDPGGCPCPVLATEPGPFVPNDVSDGRIAAVGDNAVVLVDSQGQRLRTVLVRARAAQISGRDLVVAAEGVLRQYDAVTGVLVREWQLVNRAGLQDAARGLAAYVLDGQIHLLRLSDRSDVVVASGSAARFMDAGLVYAHGTRIRVVPFDRLPLR